MRLTRIELENFKGIGNRQTIELRPITLLFGPNSAGKSTVLQALHYLREILERGNIDPDVTIAGGQTDLGDYATLVHNHELDRTIVLKTTMDLTDEQSMEDLPLNSGQYIREMEFDRLPVRYLAGGSPEYRDVAIVQEVALEIEIAWSELGQTPYVARLAIDLDGEPIAAIVSPPQEGRAQVTDFNFDHPLLRHTVLPGDEINTDTDQLFESSPLESEISSLAREAAADLSSSVLQTSGLRIAVDTKNGALPTLDRDLALDIRDPDASKDQSEERTLRVYGLRAFLSEVILGPMRVIRDYLVRMTYIGPIREVPPRSYKPQVSPDDARWARGLAAWDLLYDDKNGVLMEKTNNWLSGKNRLQTSYQFERVEFKEVPKPSLFHLLFEKGLNVDDLSELEEIYDSLANRTTIALRDFERGILVAPCDVGVGISQMVPVIVAALFTQHGILAIEQPELHVHPAIQVGMGDLFIHARGNDFDRLSSGRSLIIETHSEHILLRLLRRIRETTDGELPPGTSSLVPEDLSVVYVECIRGEAQFKSLEIDRYGEFLDRWPQGFFEERSGELF